MKNGISISFYAKKTERNGGREARKNLLFPSVPFRTVPFSYISRRSGREGEIEKEIKQRILKGEVSLYH
jgi:hypothetical protein